MSNVKRKLAMFLAVVVFTGSMHVLASNSASVKEDKSAIEQEMATSELVITGNETIEYDGSAVTFNKENGDFHYDGNGMPVWYKLKDNGTEKGNLAENYIRIRNYPKDAGLYAVTVYNEKIEEHSQPFYFEISKAPLKLMWPDKVEKIYNGDAYFNMRLKYLGGLVGNDGNNPNIEFRVRVIADGKELGVHKVTDIEMYTGSVDMNNYQLEGNIPTEVEIVSYDKIFPENTAKPGGLSTIIFPHNTANTEQVGDVLMDSTQQKLGKVVLSDTFENILNTAPIDGEIKAGSTAEKETLVTSINIAQAVKRGAYINLYVETQPIANENNAGIDKIKDTLEQGAKVLQAAQIDVSAVSVEQNDIICQLGHLVELDQKLSFTMKLSDQVTGGNFAVARVVDGQVEYLPEHYVQYNQDENTVTFKANKGGEYAVIQLA